MGPPPIIFERLMLPKQIIYRRKGNLSESPNHFKYRENILISRFYAQVSRSSRILGNFWKFVKFKFRGFTKAFKNFPKYIIAFIFAKFKYFAKQIIYLESPDHPLQNDVSNLFHFIILSLPMQFYIWLSKDFQNPLLKMEK